MQTATAVAALRDLGPGEAEAITLAVEHLGSLLLLDDRQGRLAASRFGINVIGTLGVLLVAKRKGLVTVVAKEIEKLRMRVGFRVSAELKTEVLKAAGET